MSLEVEVPLGVTTIPTEEELQQAEREAEIALMEEEQEVSPPPPTPLSVFCLYDKLLVARLDAPEAVGGIHLADISRERPAEGEVVQVGHGRLLSSGVILPLHVQVGDKVYFGKFSGNDLEIQGQMLTVLREDEILAIARV